MDSNNSAIQVFNYNSRKVRAIDKDGEVWFVGKDVAEILGYKDTDQAIRAHVDDEDKLTREFNGSGQKRAMTIINESGLYSLILSSKLLAAKKFKRWVTSEVLPAIRKTGAYALNGDMQKQLHKLEAENILLHEKVDAMLEQIAETRSFAALGKVVTLQNGVVSFSEAGKLLAQLGIKIGPNGLMKKAREKNILCKCKGRRYNQPTQKAIKNGLAVLGISFGYKGTPYLTAKGLQFFSDEYVGQFFPLLALIEGGEAVNA